MGMADGDRAAAGAGDLEEALELDGHRCRAGVVVEEDLALGGGHSEGGRDAETDALGAGAGVQEEEAALGQHAQDGGHRSGVGGEGGPHVVVDPDRSRHRGDGGQGGLAQLVRRHPGAQRSQARIAAAPRLHRQVAEDLVVAPAQGRHHLRRLALEGEDGVGDRHSQPMQVVELREAASEVVDHQRHPRRPCRGALLLAGGVSGAGGGEGGSRRDALGSGGSTGAFARGGQLRGRGKLARSRGRFGPVMPSGGGGGVAPGAGRRRLGHATRLRLAGDAGRCAPGRAVAGQPGAGGSDRHAQDEQEQACPGPATAGRRVAGRAPQAAFFAVCPAFAGSAGSSSRWRTPRRRISSLFGTSFSRKVRLRSLTSRSGFSGSLIGFLSGPV